MISCQPFEASVIKSHTFCSLSIKLSQATDFPVSFRSSHSIFCNFSTIFISFLSILTNCSSPEKIVRSGGTCWERIVGSLGIFVEETDHFISWHPQWRVDLQCFEKEVWRSSGDIGRNKAFYWNSLDLSFEVCLCFGFPGSVACEHFIENDSNSPDITFWAVLVVIESLKGHIDWRTNIVIGIFPNIRVANGKSKISNLDFPFIKKDISRFKISMHNSKSVDPSISIDNFFQNSNWLPLRNGFSTLDDFSQIPSITELSNDASMWLQWYDFI